MSADMRRKENKAMARELELHGTIMALRLKRFESGRRNLDDAVAIHSANMPSRPLETAAVRALGGTKTE